jgi:putative transposase
MNEVQDLKVAASPRRRLRMRLRGPIVFHPLTILMFDRSRVYSQARFDAFLEEYNHDRPHQALAMKVPGDVYVHSPRVYRCLEELTYPFHDTTITVTHCGRICFKGQKVNLSHAFAGKNVGVTQVGERIWLVSFMQYDLGCFDDETCRLEAMRKSLRPENVTYVPGMNWL